MQQTDSAEESPGVIYWIIDQLARVKQAIDEARLKRRWAHLRSQGMHIGHSVYLPSSTFIDTGHCFLISIGDNCGFGPDCTILAHDAQMDEFLDAGRIGRVIIHASCHIGAGTVILPSVEIGPRTVVAANSVVSQSLPPDTVCAGAPAKVVSSLDNYLAWHRLRLATRPKFNFMKYDINYLTPERRQELVAAVAHGDAYIVGGRTAELAGSGSTLRTE